MWLENLMAGWTCYIIKTIIISPFIVKFYSTFVSAWLLVNKRGYTNRINEELIAFFRF